MPRKLRRAKARALDVPPSWVTYLETAELPADESFFDVLANVGHFEARNGKLRDLWASLRDDILDVWIQTHPGRRPACWWLLDSPEPRRRLGGTGTPAHEALAYVPSFRFGVPVHFVSAFDVTYYTGMAKDVHGNPIGQKFVGSTFAGLAIDPHDPPRYESQAAFLQRLGLLEADEATDAARLRAGSDRADRRGRRRGVDSARTGRRGRREVCCTKLFRRRG